MGIFDDDKELVVKAYRSSTPLINSANYTNTRLQYLLSAIRHDNEEISDAIVASNLSGFHANARRYLNYGKRYYAFPPPQGVFVNTVDTNSLQRFLQTTIWPNRTVVVEFAERGVLDPVFFAKYWAQYNWYPDGIIRWHAGLDSFNVLRSGGGLVPVKNEPILVRTTRWDRVQYDVYFPLDGYPNANPQYGFRFGIPTQYCVQHPTGYWQIAQINVLMAYITLDGQKWLWLYDYRTGTYPQLGNTPYQVIGTYYPVAIIIRDMLDYTDLGYDVSTTTPKLLNKLNLDAEDILDEARDQEFQENMYLSDFFIHFGLGADEGSIQSDFTDTQVAYCAEFFKPFFTGTSDYSSWIAWKQGTGDKPERKGLRIQIGGENAFDYFLDWMAVRITTEYQKPTDSIDFGSRVHAYYTKLSSGSYQVVRVYELRAYYRINTNAGFRGIYLYPEIPINEAILKKFNAQDQEEILQGALRATMLSIYETIERVKWYSKTFFKILFVAITLVVVIFTAQIQLTGWALTIMGSVVSLQAILLKLAVGFLIQTTAGIAFEGEFGTIFSAILAVYMGGMNFEFTMSTITDKITFNFANVTRFISLATQLYQKVEQMRIQDEILKLQNEMEDLTSSYEELQEELEELYYGLDTNSKMSVWDITKDSAQLSLESPDVFYARTLSTNQAEVSLSIISNFYKFSLTLPSGPGDTNPVDTILQV